MQNVGSSTPPCSPLATRKKSPLLSPLHSFKNTSITKTEITNTVSPALPTMTINANTMDIGSNSPNDDPRIKRTISTNTGSSTNLATSAAAYVPEFILATIEPPEKLPTVGKCHLLEARVVSVLLNTYSNFFLTFFDWGIPVLINFLMIMTTLQT